MTDRHVLSDRDRRDIQGLVLFGTTCPLLRYHFFHVHQSAAGRRFVHTLLDHGNSLEVNNASVRDPGTRSESLVYVGLTWRGLEALAVSQASLDSMPLEFRQGAALRAAVLGDVDDSAPDHWLFNPDAAHIAVLIYARRRQTLEALSQELIDRATAHGVSLLHTLDGESLEDSLQQSGQQPTRPMHFGDSDGFIQPGVLPVGRDRSSGGPPAVPPGMFILGHPDCPDCGDTFAVANQPLPVPASLGHNGTFGAFRMLEQDVDGYEEYLDPQPLDSAVRLIRRGMAYGPPYDPANKHDGISRGMLGLYLGASLKDQFEFTTDSLSRFVRTRASAYLFFPSITGLRFISHLSDQFQTSPESEAVDEAIEVVVQSMMRAIGSGTARDAHTKHHGLVKATVDIAADIPEGLRHGLFAVPRRYNAYIRFSNGRPTPTPLPDAAPDVRGMAIKLFGVDGARETADEKHTHDFVLASHPVFFLPDVFAYVDFLRLPTLADKMRLFPELGRSFRCFENPLTIRYFSQTPYALGPHTVKYVAHPLDPAEQLPVDFTPEQTAARAPGYLREAMASHLAQRPATFALCIQLPPDEAAAQIDDATRLWESTLVRVATITVAAQDFRGPMQDRLAENISFSPWHCLTVHRPLGSVNLARRRVYREASLLRHLNGATPVKEPDGATDF